MTKPEFDAAVDTLLVQFGGSLTSGRRTDQHAISVGGFAYDPHTWGLGADVMWDKQPDIHELEHAAQRASLKVIREFSPTLHDHFQPLDFPAGPVKSYGGVTR